jgi:hypothetical protein
MKLQPKSLAMLAATTLVVAACSSSNDRNPMTPGGAVNQPPSIAAVADQTSDQDTPLGPLTIAIADQETAATALTAVLTSDNPALFPADALALAGSGGTRTLTLTPLEAATGVAMIAVQVTDGEGASTVRAFKVTVNAKSASLRSVALSTFAKAENDEATPVNGFTFTQDADDPATFESLIPAEQP